MCARDAEFRSVGMKTCYRETNARAKSS
jgi:hypothetical protein